MKPPGSNFEYMGPLFQHEVHLTYADDPADQNYTGHLIDNHGPVLNWSDGDSWKKDNSHSTHGHGSHHVQHYLF